MVEQKPCAVVMSVWGRKQLTHDCIMSLNESTNYPFWLVVVDDGSNGAGAHVIPMLRQMLDKKLIHKLILLPKHAGVTRMGKNAVNAGLKWVYDNLRDKAGYVAIQDNDFIFKDKNWLTTCIKALDMCAKVRGQDGFNIDVVSVLGENNGVHKTLADVDVGKFRIAVKPDLGGGQYVYTIAHLLGMGGGDSKCGMMYRRDENSDWAFFKRHYLRGHYCGYITHVNGQSAYEKYLVHRGNGKRVWNQRTSPA